MLSLELALEFHLSGCEKLTFSKSSHVAIDERWAVANDASNNF